MRHAADHHAYTVATGEPKSTTLTNSGFSSHKIKLRRLVGDILGVTPFSYAVKASPN